MKKAIWLTLLIFSLKAPAQNTADSNFVTVITAASWMPDGKALLLNIVKIDKTRKVPPVFKGFTFTIEGKKLEPLGFMAHQTMDHRADLVSKLDVNNPAVQTRVDAYQHAFVAKGHASDIALNEAYKAMDGAVTKQAMVLSYMDVFLYIGALFLICIPFVLLVKGNKKKKEGEKLDLSSAH